MAGMKYKMLRDELSQSHCVCTACGYVFKENDRVQVLCPGGENFQVDCWPEYLVIHDKCVRDMRLRLQKIERELKSEK